MTFPAELKKAQAESIAELYHIQIAFENFYYTSFERDVLFQEVNYQRAAIGRKAFSYDTELRSQRTKLNANFARPITDYIANTPPPLTNVTITRVFIFNTAFFQVLFKGRVINITFNDEGSAEIDCESQVKLFRSKIPSVIHQAACNNQLYDKNCKVDRNAFKVPAAVTVSGNTLQSSVFATFPADYFYMGDVFAEHNDFRLITKHEGDILTLSSPFDFRVATGSTVEAFPGCDLQPSTCRDKFSNFPNFRGFPFIPSNNPSVFGV